MSKVYSVIISEEDGAFVAVNPDTDVASQGKTIEEALANIHEALELYAEEVDPIDTKNTKQKPTFVTTITV